MFEPNYQLILSRTLCLSINGNIVNMLKMKLQIVACTIISFIAFLNLFNAKIQKYHTLWKNML